MKIGALYDWKAKEVGWSLRVGPHPPSARVLSRVTVLTRWEPGHRRLAAGHKLVLLVLAGICGLAGPAATLSGKKEGDTQDCSLDFHAI